MTILATDIKLNASERMTDTPDGGGRRTSNVIPDGVAGNIFPKVSRLDAVYGRVNLRKIYGQVATANIDTYAGAMAVVMDAPNNDRIHTNLFTTGSAFDDRTAARDRIESYLTAGPEGRMTLYGRQLLGQSAILTYQRVEDILPEPGDVYALSKETAGVTIYQQYVRVTDVTHEVRTFTDDGGDFTRRVITLKIGATLRYEFTGPENPSRLSTVARPTLIRRTNTADAARYFGVKPTVLAGAMGDLALKVSSVFSPIVPSTQRETPVSNVTLQGAASSMGSGTPGVKVNVTLVALTGANGTTKTIHLPSPALPGSVSMVASWSGGNITNFADSGAGVLTAHNGSAASSIAYETGVIGFVFDLGDGAGGGLSMAILYEPAVEVSQTAHTKQIPITLATRGTVYVQTLLPIPAPGTLVVDFRALGKWYRLRDDGTGVLTGDDAAYGTGSINYVTGGMVITLGSLPDVDSSVLLAWGSPAHYVVRAGATSDASTAIEQTLQLTALPVSPGSLTVSWVSGGVTKNATGAALVLSGNATGTVDATTGLVAMNYGTFVPDAGSLVTASYNQLVASGATPVTDGGAITVADPATITLPHAVAASSLTMFGYVYLPSNPALWYQLRIADNGAGSMVTLDQRTGPYGGSMTVYVPGGQVVGTINYGTGVVSLTSGGNGNWSDWNGSAWVPASGAFAFTATDYSYAMRTGAASTNTASSQTFDASATSAQPLQINFTKTIAQAIVPGSLMFSFTGKTYIERNGTLYTDINPLTGSGIEAGSIDYATGLANITYWADGVAGGLAVLSCLTIYGLWTATSAYFRTAGSPIRPSSGYVQVTSTDGDLLTASSNEGGTLTGAFAEGVIQQDMGVVQIRWGEWLVAAGHETDPWYDVANVVGANVWKPREVMPTTLTYNCVVLSNLPLNADILGLDPVRLPNDGKVPIYRPADVVVIHNTKSYALPNPAVAAAVYDVGRTLLSDLWLIDALGVRVPLTHYIADIATGTVTMDAALNLGAIPQPLVARHRIEELNLLSDVQINGLLSLTGPLTRAYDATDTLVSSALLFGDMFARVVGVFDQGTWTGAWSDLLIGAQATAQYNTIDYPVEVLNNGCVTERWRINFTSTTAFQLIGENLGQIATGTTAADLTVTNALTGLPYFVLRAAGWGAGWAVGNQLRFNTVGASAPIWIARTVLPGATLSGDSFDLQLRGDVDA